jgi:hypothetical protein
VVRTSSRLDARLATLNVDVPPGHLRSFIESRLSCPREAELTVIGGRDAIPGVTKVLFTLSLERRLGDAITVDVIQGYFRRELGGCLQWSEQLRTRTSVDSDQSDPIPLPFILRTFILQAWGRTRRRRERCVEGGTARGVVKNKVALELDGCSVPRIIVLKRAFLNREGVFGRSNDLGRTVDVGISSGWLDAEGRYVQDQVIARPLLSRPHVVTHEQALASALSEGPLFLRFLRGVGLIVHQAPEGNEMAKERFLVAQLVRRAV